MDFCQGQQPWEEKDRIVPSKSFFGFCNKLVEFVMGLGDDPREYFFLGLFHHFLEFGFLYAERSTAALAFSRSSFPSFFVFIDVIFFKSTKIHSNSLMDPLPFIYPSCPIENHAQEPLSRLCLDKNCSSKVPVCCICQFEKHAGHNTVPIKHILKRLQDSSEMLSPVEGAGKLGALRKQFFQATSKCRRQILDGLNQLQTKGELYFNSCEQTLLNFYSLGGTFPPEAQTDPKFYKKYFTKLLTLIPQNDKNAFGLEERVNSLIESYRMVQKRLVDQLAFIEASFRKSIQTAEHIFGGSGTTYEARWSQTLKGAKVKLNNMIVEQSGMESSGQRFALMEHPLSEGTKTQWGIKVKKFVGWVGVGICLMKKISSANYHFNYTNIGHGSYLISTNGYTWSHSVKEFNSAFKCFQFTINDVVYIEYDPQNLKLRFRKNQGNDKYELDIVSPPSGDVYHPCVNLCSTGDSVELILPGIPLS